jgi:hypothetical protein
LVDASVAFEAAQGYASTVPAGRVNDPLFLIAFLALVRPTHPSLKRPHDMTWKVPSTASVATIEETSVTIVL